ncbi:tRNA1(Val) (adenine(37)-N6)-methyltransferase [Tabrizicola thermarum]|uniref:tRNA1(Val) (adenine(37)-N6)-methyltransferase n=1 Tax=Tabrizicola thermarum TaxID=2670345 RepID=UPI000FFC5128|nr:methyltransferase [Tabrizicola thermarum]
MFADAELSDDKFLCGRLRLLQPLKGYRAATDPVLLAAACPAEPGQSVLDLGCGAGAAALCLGLRVSGLALAGLELQPAYADLARRNALRNGIAVEVHEGDLTRMPPSLRRDFDHVIANPPYYPAQGSPSPVAARARAMQVDTPLSAWVAAATRRLRPGGWLTLICGADGLPEVLGALAPKMGSAAVLPLAPRDGRPALRVLLRARKGGRAPFRLLAPFVIHQGAAHDGDRESYTPAANAVLRDGADLLDQFG